MTSWRLFDVWTSYFGIKGQYDLTFDLKINVGLCDLYFMDRWLGLISPRLFDAWMSYFQIMRQCGPNFDLIVNINQHDLYFMVWWFCLISSRYLMDEHHSWYNGSVWHIVWLYQVYVGQWPIFYGPAILLHILKIIWWRNVVLGIMDQCDSKINLVKYMWVSGLYFMVHWFYLISLSDLNYFYTLRNCTGRGVFVPLRALALVFSIKLCSNSSHG